MKHLVLVIAVTAACSDGGSKTPDAAPVVFTGEYVDWDSTDASFCGIFNATFALRTDATNLDHTNPNGRFTLTIALGKTAALVDITPPTGASECLASMSTYSMPGIAVADPDVIAASQIISLRSFSAARVATLGFTPDPASGHVFVHVDGTASAVSIAGSSDPAQQFDGSTWSAGNTGVNVFFPNVAPGMTMVTMGSAIGNGDVPVEAGKITYVTLVGS